MKKYLYILVILLYLVIVYRVIDIRLLNNSYYVNLYNNKYKDIVYGTYKRGRILDRNNKVLVDNKTIYNINYRIINNTKYIDIFKIACMLNDILELKDSASIKELKDFYILFNDTSNLLSEGEIKDYKYHRLDKNDIYNITYDRLNIDNIYSDIDSINIHTFFKMISGYKYDTKLIKSDVDYSICKYINDLKIDGLECNIDYKRVINYPFIESIVGNVGSIRLEDKDKYLSKGYLIDDKVGISGLEEYYEDVLRGKKSKYKINGDNTLTLLEEDIPGKDIVLAIDIDMQEYAYNLLKQSFIDASKLNNTKYYNEGYIIVSDVNTGEIITMMGLNKDNKDISINSILSSYIVGSIVKGASHTVSYLNNLIDIGKKINDSCVKLYQVPMKCSFKRLGYIDDISALKLSSNYYQFINAIKSTNNSYYPNIKIEVNEDNFNKYRDIFKKFGLGSKTNIDLYNESTGITGKKIASDLLLNLVIGQYDTYTPIELTSYINTIANKGKRLSLSLIKKQNEVIDNIDMDDKYWNRIQEGLYQVVNERDGTGLGYSDKKIKAVGKTGTAQNYISKDLMTINSTYVMYAPRDNPKYSVVVLTPNISYYNDIEYIAPINRIISKKMTNYVFENN